MVLQPDNAAVSVALQAGDTAAAASFYPLQNTLVGHRRRPATV